MANAPDAAPATASPPRRKFKRIDLLYKEYVRIAKVLDTYVAGSFADFKLLSVLGSIATMATGALALVAHEGQILIPHGAILPAAFALFLGSLGIVAIVSFR